MLPQDNPLLDFSGLPRFADIQPVHVTPAVDQLLAENRALIDRLASAPEQLRICVSSTLRIGGRCNPARC